MPGDSPPVKYKYIVPPTAVPYVGITVCSVPETFSELRSCFAWPFGPVTMPLKYRPWRGCAREATNAMVLLRQLAWSTEKKELAAGPPNVSPKTIYSR